MWSINLHSLNLSCSCLRICPSAPCSPCAVQSDVHCLQTGIAGWCLTLCQELYRPMTAYCSAMALRVSRHESMTPRTNRLKAAGSAAQTFCGALACPGLSQRWLHSLNARLACFQLLFRGLDAFRLQRCHCVWAGDVHKRAQDCVDHALPDWLQARQDIQQTQRVAGDGILPLQRLQQQLHLQAKVSASQLQGSPQHARYPGSLLNRVWILPNQASGLSGRPAGTIRGIPAYLTAAAVASPSITGYKTFGLCKHWLP